MNNLIQQTYGNSLDPQGLLRRFAQMESKKQSWRAKWQKIQDMAFPTLREYTSKTYSGNPGTEKIANHCSAISGKITKAISNLHSQISDPMSKWISLKFRRSATMLTDGQAVDFSENQLVATWLQQCEEALYDLFNDPRSNFYPSSYVFHRDWFVLGTACRHICIRRDTGDIHFNAIGMDDIFIDLGAYDQIEVVARKYNLTADQAFTLWGEGVGDEVMQTLQQPTGKYADKKFEFVEMCFETPPEVRQNNQFAMAPYLSVVIQKSGKNIVSISPEQSFPYIVARYDVDAGGLYGKSLVWLAMPDITLINRISKRNVQAIDYAATPPILAMDALSLNTGQLSPGAIVQGLDSDGRPSFQPLMMGNNLPLAMQFYEQKLAELDDQLMASDVIPPDLRGNMTPTEVIERKLQWNNRIRPILVRLEREDLQSTCKRALQLLQIKGELPGFPYNSVGITPEQLPDPINMINIAFSGPLAKMRRLQDVQNMDNLTMKAMQYGQVDQSILHLLKLPDVIKEEADIFDVPKTIMKTDEELQMEAEMAQKQAEAMQQQQAEQEELQRLMMEGQLKKNGVEEIPEDIL